MNQESGIRNYGLIKKRKSAADFFHDSLFMIHNSRCGFTPTPEFRQLFAATHRWRWLKMKFLQSVFLFNKKMNSSRNLVWGFTLIETIVAMGVILAATVGPLALVTSGIADFAYTKNKLIAVNLAQEGVELTRSVRDDNTLCDTINGAPVWPWNRDPQSGGTFVNFVGEISIDQTMNIDCGIGTYQGNPVVIKVPLLPPDGCINKLRLDTTTGIYGHNGDKETIFSRCVQIMVPPVCIDQDAPDATCPDSDVLLSDQMEIISTVIWSEKGRQNTAVLRERIYNWK